MQEHHSAYFSKKSICIYRPDHKDCNFIGVCVCGNKIKDLCTGDKRVANFEEPVLAQHGLQLSSPRPHILFLSLFLPSHGGNSAPSAQNFCSLALIHAHTQDTSQWGKHTCFHSLSSLHNIYYTHKSRESEREEIWVELSEDIWKRCKVGVNRIYFTKIINDLSHNNLSDYSLSSFRYYHKEEIFGTRGITR